jgi:pullulanase/glycogen debranching enzyme
LVYTLTRSQEDHALHIIVNAWEHSLRFAIPRAEAGLHWYRAIDTSQPPTQDIADPGMEQRLGGYDVEVAGRTVVVLVER